MFQKSSSQISDNKKVVRMIKRAGFKKLTPLQEKVIPLILQDKNLVVETGVSNGKTVSFLLPLFLMADSKKQGLRTIILTNSLNDVRKIKREFIRLSHQPDKKLKNVFLGPEDDIKKERKLILNSPDIITGTAERIIDHIRLNNLSFESVSTVIIDVPANDNGTGFDKDILYIKSKLPKISRFLLFFETLTGKEVLLRAVNNPQVIEKAEWEKNDNSINNFSQIKGIQESTEMEKQNHTDDNLMKESIKHMVKKIREEEDPNVLNHFRKIVRKNVPITMRAYFAAYLYKESLGNKTVGQRSPSLKSRSGMATLFVSIGKNRKVFPGDLSGLVTKKLKTETSSIGAVKILDNYSFIDVPEKDAQKAIDSLNGSEFKGRKITVNFARKNR